MSLINDALKKAARQRSQEANVIPPMPGGGGNYGQGRPKSMQTLVLIGGGAIALIVVSVVVTGMMMNRAPAAKAAPVTAPAATPAAPTPVPQKPVVQIAPITISLPQAEPPVHVAVPTIAPTAAPRPKPTQVPIVRAEPTPVETPPPAVPTPAVSAQTQSDTVQALVDGFLISGVRSAGSESKALINGHVYKLNDLVDKALGLRLVKVEQDKLTFVTRDGSTFVKTF